MDKTKLQYLTDQAFVTLIARCLFSLVQYVCIFWIGFYIIRYGIKESGRDVFNVLLGIIGTAFVYNSKYWFERSSDYSESKNVERANKVGETTTVQDEAGKAQMDIALNIIQKQKEEIERLLKDLEELKVAKPQEPTKPEENAS